MPSKHTRKKERHFKPTHYKVVRVDASVGGTERGIERLLGLPQGSVHLRLPSGREARAEQRIRALPSDWGY